MAGAPLSLASQERTTIDDRDQAVGLISQAYWRSPQCPCWLCLLSSPLLSPPLAAQGRSLDHLSSVWRVGRRSRLRELRCTGGHLSRVWATTLPTDQALTPELPYQGHVDHQDPRSVAGANAEAVTSRSVTPGGESTPGIWHWRIAGDASQKDC